jgi:hypothetical protein
VFAERISESWVGQQIETMIVRADSKVRATPLTVLEQLGTLGGVNKMGIVIPDEAEEPFLRAEQGLPTSPTPLKTQRSLWILDADPCANETIDYRPTP